MNEAWMYGYRPAAHLVVSDEDAADFLQSQFSQDLRPFERGQCRYGLWLNVKGKVLGDGFVLCEGDSAFRIYSYRSAGEVIRETLAHHIIADDVIIEQGGAGFGLSLFGPQAAKALESATGTLPEAGEFRERDGVRIFHGRRDRGGSFELLTEDEGRLEAVQQRLAGDGVALADSFRLERQRIESGIPAVPEEVGPEDLPGEGALEAEAVSLTKGCFLGQEVVARMHHVGRAQRALFVIEGKGPLPALPSAVEEPGEGRPMGQLRTAYPDGEGWQGVSLLKLRRAAPGAPCVVGGAGARILRPLEETVGKVGT